MTRLRPRFFVLAALITGALLPVADAQGGGRPGVALSYVQIGGATPGMEGRAYLPTTPSWVTVDSGPASCAGGRLITLSARSRTGHVREVRVLVNANGPGVIPFGGTGCPSASVEATLEDGTVLQGGEGNLTVRALTPAGSPVLDATFSWSPMLNGHPMPMRGIVIAPAAAPSP